MPYKQKKPCAYPGCPELTHDKYCEKHQQQANRYYDRYHHTEENYSRHHNSRWKEIRSVQLHRQPLCEMCLKEDRTKIYMTNNQMKETMLLCGFFPTDPNELNWSFYVWKSSPMFKRKTDDKPGLPIMGDPMDYHRQEPVG